MGQVVEGSGKATAPTAGTAVATLAVPSAGEYDITVNAMVSGAAAADTGNMGLYQGTGTGSPIAAPTPHGVSGAFVSQKYPSVPLTGLSLLTVQAIGNGTASIVYAATIIAEKVE